MSGQLKEIRTRIKSVKSTQQITKAMKMVSAAKLRRATDAILQMRPYSNKLSDMLTNIVSNMEGEIEIEYAKERPAEKILIVAITSDKGLCGGFNSSVTKLVKSKVDGEYAEQNKAGNVQILTIGKKGMEFFKYRNYPVNDSYNDLFTRLSFEEVAKAIEWIMESFENGTYDRVEVCYQQFKNAATQITQYEQILPITKLEAEESDDNAAKHRTDFVFEPDKAYIIEEMVPKILKTQFFKFLLESNASEHGARMTAMDKATENANELESAPFQLFNEIHSDFI